MIRKILIATDGSEHANKAAAFGCDIAAKHDADVVLIHVLLRNELSENLRHWATVEHLAGEGGRPLSEVIASTPLGRFPAGIVISAEDAATPDRVLRAAAEMVLDEARRIASEHGISRIDTRIEDGDPVGRILEVAEAEAVDLVVSGARGLSDLKALLIGSVSHKLLHLSPVTCLTVR